MIPILVAPSAFQLQTPITPPTKNTVEVYLKLPKSSFPDQTQNYNQTVVQPCQARGGTISGYACVLPPPPPVPTVSTPATVTAAPEAPQTLEDGLTGALGYSLSGGNCVDMARAYGKLQPGNPISWIPSTQTPFIGAAALFPFNHVGVVVGLWSDGSVEIAQENAPGMPHRFPASEFRGFF